MTATETRKSPATFVADPRAMHAKAVELCKHVLRMTTAAGSGHPSTALALAHVMVELMYRRMRYDPADPWNPASDRLVLSIGHAVPIVYAAYADLGGVVGSDLRNARPLVIDDLKGLRELSSVLDGHPNPAEGFPFFDAATGSLGQGLSVAAGLALAARLDRLDKRVFVVAGDGESREGQVWEAFDFMVDHKIGNVGVIISCNGEGQAGPVSPQQSADSLAAKVQAFGWKALVVDGHDPDELASAFDQLDAGLGPTAILARTVKGWGVEMMQGKDFHGKPLPPGDLEHALRQLDDVATRLDARPGRSFQVRLPTAVAQGSSPTRIELPPFEASLERAGLQKAVANRKLSTRAAYGAALVALGNQDPRIVALDGDVSNSTFANLFARQHPQRFYECKIAEQNMLSAAVGLAAAGKIPFASSFAKFIARATDQIDMACITRANVKIVGSHSGVSLAADGPSQMSLSDLAYFRSMAKTRLSGEKPACYVFHPSDAVCCFRCVELMANFLGMCYLRTHRPEAGFLYALDEPFDLCGWKQLRSGRDLTIVSSGFILHTVLTALPALADAGITCNVFDVFAFPLDAAGILACARQTGGGILTVEDNYAGGLHAEIAEVAAEVGNIPVRGLTVGRIPKSGRTPDEVFSHVGVGLNHIITAAADMLRRPSASGAR